MITTMTGLLGGLNAALALLFPPAIKAAVWMYKRLRGKHTLECKDQDDLE